MRCLVGGGTGLIGQRLVASLTASGHQAVVLTRNPAAVKFPCERALAWDPMTQPLPAGALDGVDAVVHLAGEGVADRRWSDAQKRRILDSRVLGTRAMVDAIRQAQSRPATFVCASAVGVYGDQGDAQLTEQSAPGRDFLASVCTQWEAAAAAVEPLGVRRVSARFGVVLAERGGALARMLPVFRAGLGGRLGSGRQYFPWIHIEDAVALILHALTTPGIRGPLNVTSPQPATNAAFTDALGHALHRPTVMLVPALALKLALGELATSLLASQRVMPRAALESGFTFRHPVLSDALRTLV